MIKAALTAYFLAVLVGLLTGLVGSFFQIAINKSHQFLHFLSQRHALFAVIFSLLLAWIAWFLVQTFAKTAAGSGVQEIEGILLHKRSFDWQRILPVKWIGGWCAISAGLVVGREGPTIQMGGCLGALVANMMQVASNRRDTLIAAGAAAGLSCAFNAPLAGILFVIEEMRNAFHFNFTNFKMVAISCMMASIVLEWFLGPQPAISMMIFQQPNVSSLSIFLGVGLVSGVAGIFFNRGLLYSLQMVDTLTQKQHGYYVLALGALVGWIGLWLPDMVGGGYMLIEHMLGTLPSLSTLLLFAPLRFLLTFCSYATRVPGGIFAPMLALGTLLGLIFFQILHAVLPNIHMHPNMLALAGMAALFAASVRAPLTGVVLLVEMTQNYSLILPLMVSCFTSSIVAQLAKSPPIYAELLRRSLQKG